MQYRKYYNIFFVICLFVLLFLIARQIINNNSIIWIVINSDYLLFVCALLFYFNNKRFIGILLVSISFLIYLFVVIFYIPERIIKPATFLYLIAVISLVFPVFVKDRRKWEKR